MFILIILFLLGYLTDPVFDADNEKDAELLTENKNYVFNLHKKLLIIVNVTVIFWILSFFLKKINDDNTYIPSSFPFETKTWKGYAFKHIYSGFKGL